MHAEIIIYSVPGNKELVAVEMHGDSVTPERVIKTLNEELGELGVDRHNLHIEIMLDY